jgi:DNA polymerase/3'-5' exonuclease PolX
MSEKLNRTQSEEVENPKKENASKEKKVKPKYYAGTKVEKLPKVPKKYMEDIMNVEALSPEQLEKFYTAIALGLIPDRFGMEASLDTRLKAMKGIQEIREAKLREQTEMNAEQQELFAIDFVHKQKKQADDLVDKEEVEEDDSSDNELPTETDLL